MARTARMRRGRWLPVIPVLLLLAGCDSIPTRFVTGLSAEERALAAQLPVYRDRLPEGGYQFLGPVSGLSCETGPGEGYRASEENALEELKRAAFRVGGNAVMEARCEFFPRARGSHNCLRAFECSGNAVRRPVAAHH